MSDVHSVLRRLGSPRADGLIPDGVSAVDAGDRVVATYVLQGSPSLEAAAEAIVVEESTGTTHAAPDVAARVGGEVLDVEVQDESPLASMAAPLARGGVGTAEVGRVTVAWEAENARSIPGLLTMVVGEANETGAFPACRLVGLALPPEVLAAGGGPRWGVDGVRTATGAHDRPVLAAIVKPSTGLDPASCAVVAAELARGGADLVKDDELLLDPPHCPFSERVRLVCRALDDVAEETGRRAVYAPNVTGPLDGLESRLALAVTHGSGAVMVNALVMGLEALRWTASRGGAPVLAHRVLSGALTRSDALGVSPGVLAGLTRLCGGDLVQAGAVAGKIFEDDATVVDAASVCRRPLGPLSPAMPVSGGGQSAATVGANADAFGSPDFCHLLGSVATDDPDGARAGVARAVEAWRAVMPGKHADRVKNGGVVR